MVSEEFNMILEPNDRKFEFQLEEQIYAKECVTQKSVLAKFPMRESVGLHPKSDY